MELYQSYHQPLYHNSYSILKNRDDAQEEMIKASEKLDQFQADGNFGGWLRKIVIRKSIAYYQYNKHMLGDIELRGKTTTTSFRLSGSGDIKASSFESVEAQVRVTGSGDIEIHSSSKVIANITSSGDIVCYGNPQIQQIKTICSGDVRVAN